MFVPVRIRKRKRKRERERERYTFVNGENVDDSMTHEVLYGSRNIGRHDGGGGFASRVLETGKVHGDDGTADESTVESARGNHVVREGFRARKATM